MKNSIVSLVFIIMVAFTNAQVAINEDGSNPEPSAMLDISSLDKGILIPRMREAQRVAIVNPEESLLVYQSDNLAGFYYYAGTNWLRITDALSSSVEKIDDLSDARSDDSSIYLGNGSGINDDGGNFNVGIGGFVLNDNSSGSHNIANGYQSLYKNVTGSYNIALGFSAMYSNTSGSYNIAYGNNALSDNTSGIGNIALGSSALIKNTIGGNNIALGSGALFKNLEGNHNIAFGNDALFFNTSGVDNIALGQDAFKNNQTGNRNTVIGANSFNSTNATAFSNSIAIGYNAEPGASNTARIGNASVMSIGGYASWTNVSDARFKKDINNNVPGLDFVLQLRPVTYKLDMDAIARFTKTPNSLRLKDAERLKENIIQTGFLAQEVEQAAQKIAYNFSGVDAPKNSNDHYGLRYAEFVVPLVKSVQEQQNIIEEQQEEIDELKILVQQLIYKK